jgi:hypothetical protein
MTTTTTPPVTTTTVAPLSDRLTFPGGPETAEFTERVVTVFSAPGVVDTRVTTSVEGRFSAPSDYAYTLRTGAGVSTHTSEIVTLGFDHWILEEHKQWRSAAAWDIWYTSFHSEHGLASSDVDLETMYDVLADHEFEIEERDGVPLRVYELTDDVLGEAVAWDDFTGEFYSGDVLATSGKVWISAATYDLVELFLSADLDLGGVEGLEPGTTAQIAFTLVLNSINETIAEIAEPEVPEYAGLPDDFLPYADAAAGIELAYPQEWTISLGDDAFYFYGEPVVNLVAPFTRTDITIEVLDLAQFAGLPLDRVVEWFEEDFVSYGLEKISRDAITVGARDGVSSKWRYLVEEMVVHFELTLLFDGDRAIVVVTTIDEFAEPIDGPQIDELIESIELTEPTGGVTG